MIAEADVSSVGWVRSDQVYQCKRDSVIVSLTFWSALVKYPYMVLMYLVFVLAG